MSLLNTKRNASVKAKNSLDCFWAQCGSLKRYDSDDVPRRHQPSLVQITTHPTVKSVEEPDYMAPTYVTCYFYLTRSKHVWQLTCMQKWTWKDTCVSLILAQYSLSITDHRCTSAIFNTAKSYHRLAQIQIWERAKVCVVLAGCFDWQLNWKVNTPAVAAISTYFQSQVNCQKIRWILNICLSERSINYLTTTLQPGKYYTWPCRVDHPVTVKSILNFV